MKFSTSSWMDWITTANSLLNENYFLLPFFPLPHSRTEAKLKFLRMQQMPPIMTKMKKKMMMMILDFSRLIEDVNGDVLITLDVFKSESEHCYATHLFGNNCYYHIYRPTPPPSPHVFPISDEVRRANSSTQPSRWLQFLIKSHDDQPHYSYLPQNAMYNYTTRRRESWNVCARECFLPILRLPYPPPCNITEVIDFVFKEMLLKHSNHNY